MNNFNNNLITFIFLITLLITVIGIVIWYFRLRSELNVLRKNKLEQETKEYRSNIKELNKKITETKENLYADFKKFLNQDESGNDGSGSSNNGSSNSNLN